MRFLAHHVIEVSALVLGALVLVGLVVLVVRGLHLVRSVRADRRRVNDRVGTLMDAAAETERAAARLADDQAGLEAAIAVLARETGQLRILLAHAAQALAVLRAPIRYLGR